MSGSRELTKSLAGFILTVAVALSFLVGGLSAGMIATEQGPKIQCCEQISVCNDRTKHPKPAPNGAIDLSPALQRWVQSEIETSPVETAEVATQSLKAVRDDNSQIAAVGQKVTFNRDIAPIVFHYCASCHRPGEAGPFPLLTYDDVKKHGRQIASRHANALHATMATGTADPKVCRRAPSQR